MKHPVSLKLSASCNIDNVKILTYEGESPFENNLALKSTFLVQFELKRAFLEAPTFL